MKRIIVAAVAGAMLAVPSVAIADTFTVCHEGGCTESTETVITVKDASGFTFTTSVESLHAEAPVFDEGVVPASEPTTVTWIRESGPRQAPVVTGYSAAVSWTRSPIQSIFSCRLISSKPRVER